MFKGRWRASAIWLCIGVVALTTAWARAEPRPSGQKQEAPRRRSPAASELVDFLPCAPQSEFLPEEAGLWQADPQFCSVWNPEYSYRGNRCCPKLPLPRGKRKDRCAPQRFRSNFCSEMTEEQRRYSEEAASGKLGDLLEVISRDIGRKGPQAYCTVNTGFLAHGRRVIPTPANRIKLRTPNRCVDFGTDEMVGMLEWVGHQIPLRFPGEAYQNVRLLVGDLSAPRGGCMPGRYGRRGHSSHTSGQDADIGFLQAKPWDPEPAGFSKKFDPVLNWWLIKQFFRNPFACVKVVFSDHKLIRQMAKAARGDPDWDAFRPFIRHMRGHRNHLHVRIGDGPGAPGCPMDFNDELEDEDEGEVPGLSESPELSAR